MSGLSFVQSTFGCVCSSDFGVALFFLHDVLVSPTFNVGEIVYGINLCLGACFDVGVVLCVMQLQLDCSSIFGVALLVMQLCLLGILVLLFENPDHANFNWGIS